jgi:hypothetical protein
MERIKPDKTAFIYFDLAKKIISGLFMIIVVNLLVFIPLIFRLIFTGITTLLLIYQIISRFVIYKKNRIHI